VQLHLLIYAAGELDEARTVDELSRWDYAPILLPTDDVNDIAIIPDGSYDDVRQAVSEGLITWEMYEEIWHRRDRMFPVARPARPTDGAERAAQILLAPGARCSRVGDHVPGRPGLPGVPGGGCRPHAATGH